MNHNSIIKKLNRTIVKGINNHCYGKEHGYLLKCYEKSQFDDKPCYCIESCYRAYIKHLIEQDDFPCPICHGNVGHLINCPNGIVTGERGTK